MLRQDGLFVRLEGLANAISIRQSGTLSRLTEGSAGHLSVKSLSPTWYRKWQVECAEEIERK